MHPNLQSCAQFCTAAEQGCQYISGTGSVNHDEAALLGWTAAASFCSSFSQDDEYLLDTRWLIGSRQQVTGFVSGLQPDAGSRGPPIKSSGTDAEFYD